MPNCPKCHTEYTGDLCPECAEKESYESAESPTQTEQTKTINEVLNTIHPNIYVRTTIKVVLMVLLLGVIALVVFGADYGIEWVKGLF